MSGTCSSLEMISTTPGHKLHNQRRQNWRRGGRWASGCWLRYRHPFLDFLGPGTAGGEVREAQALGAGFAICYVHAPLEEAMRRLEHRVQAGAQRRVQAISQEDMGAGPPYFQPRTQETAQGIRLS